MSDRPHIFDLDPDSLRELVVSWGLPRFRGDQVLEWVYAKKVGDPATMTNLSKADRELLAQRLTWTRGVIIGHQRATDGVQKLLIDWDENSKASPITATDSTAMPGYAAEDAVAKQASSTSLDVLNSMASKPAPLATECVMIPAKEEPRDDEEFDAQDSATPSRRNTSTRRTACISSQIGCPVGCHFCASGVGGLDGNLTAGQIVEQVWHLSRLPTQEPGAADARDTVGRISHVVFMGMGEPLANFDNVTRAIRTLTAPWAFGISARRITISTVGVPSAIRRLASLELPVTLALSLHAPTDEIRRQLIPWAQYVTIAQLLEACDEYFHATGREITLEYTMLRGINDLPGHALQLATLARRLRANVNLIRYNEVKGMPFSRPATEDVLNFQATLRRAGINTHIRASRGRDIAAACGQLRHESVRSA